MNLIGDLRTVCDAYCLSASMKREQVSYQVFKDQRRLDRVFAGTQGLTVKSYEAAMSWLAEHWPDEAVWPEGIVRPLPDLFGAADSAAAEGKVA